MTFDELMRLGHVTVLNVGTNHVIVTFLPYVNINQSFQSAGPDLAAALANLESQLPDLADSADALVELLANDRDSADDVKADLVALGVDVAASRASYKAFLKTLERQAALEQMGDATRRSAARSAAREERRRQIAEQGLSMAELQRRIGALGGKRAARGHETDTRDDLESHLADLMDSEEE